MTTIQCSTRSLSASSISPQVVHYSLQNRLRLTDCVELRNHVYSHTVEVTTLGFGEKKKYLFLHLTQACKQIREEFRPVYMRTSVADMGLPHLLPYLDAFLPGWNERDVQKEDWTADIWVHYTTDFLHIHGSLLPLIQLLVTAPKLHISVYHNPFRKQTQLHEIFKRSKTQWADFVLDGSIEDVNWTPAADLGEEEEFIRDPEQGAFCVRLKKHYDAPWIEYHPEGADISDDAEAVKFLENLGFARKMNAEDLPVWVELQSDVGMDVSSYRKVIDVE
jgi:hypothetical protein